MKTQFSQGLITGAVRKQTEFHSNQEGNRDRQQQRDTATLRLFSAAPASWPLHAVLVPLTSERRQHTGLQHSEDETRSSSHARRDEIEQDSSACKRRDWGETGWSTQKNYASKRQGTTDTLKQAAAFFTRWIRNLSNSQL